MKSGKKLLSFLIFLGVSACSPLSHTPPPSLAGPVATAVLPTSTPMGNFVEVTRVVVTAVSTATPAPCTPLTEGMHLTIRSEDGQTILLEAEGLLPEDKPIVLLKGKAAVTKTPFT